MDGLSQIAASSDCSVTADESKQSAENAGEIDEPCSTSADVYISSALSVDNGNPGRYSASDFPMAPSVSLGHVVPQDFSVMKSCGEAISSNSVECRVPQTVSFVQQYSMSSLPTCVQSLHSPVMCCSATLLSSPPSAASPSPRPSATNRQPVAVNWDVRKSPVSALDAPRLSQATAAKPFAAQNASKFPAHGHSSHSENSRHRSVKAGSTWFPTELQTSLDLDKTKKRSVEHASSARPCISSGSGKFNSPLKKFVDRHPTRHASAQNLPHSSAGVGVSRNANAAACAANQPIDLSIQRRKVEPKSEQSRQPNTTHFDTMVSDEPLDLSHSSSSVRSDRQIPRHQSHYDRPSDSGNNLPSGVIDLQNYCSRLLSGGYSLDSQPSAINSSLSFSSLVSKTYLLTNKL